MANKMGSETLEPSSKGIKETGEYEIKEFSSSSLLLEKEMSKEYLNFIKANWLNSLKCSGKQWRWMDRDSFFSKYSAYIDTLLLKPQAKVRIASSWYEDAKINVAYGWCVYENEILHYIFVKDEVRSQGLGRKLVPKGIIRSTHMTEMARDMWLKYFNYMRYDPFI